MGGAHESYLRVSASLVPRPHETVSEQTAKMAEGQTRAKCELSISAFDMCQAKLSPEHLAQLLYLYEYDLVFSPPTAPATPTLKELSNVLDSVVNWYLLGVKLDLQDHELHTIERNYRGDSERCKHEMLSRWLRTAKLATWKAVTDALQQMGERTVALNIQAKYCTDTGKLT